MIGQPGRPLLYSGQPLYVVTGRREDGSFAFISFEPEWNIALEKAKESIRGEFTRAYVSDIHAGFHK